MADEVGYKWKPIEDLPEGYELLADSDLRSLETEWKAIKNDLAGSGFIERLQREWAIETGIIERIYTLDRGITETLIQQGITAALIPPDATDKDSELVAEIIQDHLEAIEGLFDFIKGTRDLSVGYVKELHALLTRNQQTAVGVDKFGNKKPVPLIHGDYKKWPNNPKRPDGLIHEYCPPEQVTSEMDKLIEWHIEHIKMKVPVDLEAAWLHHRFVQIHPFQDGNGRVARALATLVFIKEGWFPLVVTDADRAVYISALEKADNHDLKPLVNLFNELVRRYFIIALNLVSGEKL